MLAKFFKEYLSFSKKERIAVIILVFLIVIIFSLPYLLPTKKENFDETRFAKFREEASRLRMEKDVPLAGNDEITSPATPPVSRRYLDSDKGESNVKAKLFFFDPNTLAIDGWKKLGIPERNIRTIYNYLSKGGKFRKAEDLEKIYGLRSTDAARLKPFVRIRSVTPEYPVRKPPQQSRHDYGGSLPAVKTPPVTIDLNLSDTAGLISLPGIGSKLATRIIRFREKLGGFYTAQQLAEVYGLPDSTFQNLQHRVTVNGTPPKKINVNTATLQELQDHPYLRGTAARLIFEHRREHGNFKTLDELLHIETITPELFEKLTHYLTIIEKP